MSLIGSLCPADSAFNFSIINVFLPSDRTLETRVIHQFAAHATLQCRVNGCPNKVHLRPYSIKPFVHVNSLFIYNRQRVNDIQDVYRYVSHVLCTCGPSGALPASVRVLGGGPAS
jgi:hypothetical protein